MDALGRGDRAATWKTTLALVIVVVLAAAVYAIAAQVVPMPLYDPDELRYTLAARGLAEGEGLHLRGEEYGYGALYPAVLAVVLALAGDIDAAFPLFKVANALLFALAAVPIYFVARRLLSHWWSVAVAATSVLIPSSVYTSLVLTESAAYLASSVAVLALVLALERPSPARQLALVGAVGLAFATRPQFAALLPAFLVGHAFVWALDAGRPRLRDAAARLWPTASALLVGVAALAARPLLTGSSPESLGGYADLWRGYDILSVARFVVYHLAGLEIYLFVMPFAVAPIVLHGLLHGARRGSRRDAAFAATFLAVNAALLLIAAAFASTPFGWGALHDRYLFYVTPLWFVVFGAWLSQGLPRPLAWTAMGVSLALLLPAVTPHRLIAGNSVVEFVPTALWAGTWEALEGYPLVDGRKALAAMVVVLALATAAVPRRLWAILPAVAVTGLLLSESLAWQRIAAAPRDLLAADDGARAWVDDAVPEGSSATKLYFAPPECPGSELIRHALFLTELFNTSVERAVAIGNAPPDGLPLDRGRIRSRGRLLLEDGRPLVADYVVAQPGLVLEGRRVAAGTGANLVLWETDGVVRLAETRALAAHGAAAGCG